MAVYLGSQNRRVKKAPIIIGVLIAVVLIGGGIFLWTSQAQPTTGEATPSPETTETTQGTLPSDAFRIQVTN